MDMSLVINEGIIYDKGVVTASVTSSHYMPVLTRHTVIATANILDINVFIAGYSNKLVVNEAMPIEDFSLE